MLGQPAVPCLERRAHPVARDCDLARLGTLTHMPSSTAARPVVQIVRDALLFSSLRLQHIHGALTPRCRGEVVRALHGVVAVRSDGQTPPLMRSWVAIASFAALREKR